MTDKTDADVDTRTIKDAIEALGGFTATTKLLMDRGLVEAITPQAIFNWSLRGFGPPEYAILFEELTGIPRENLIDPRHAALFVGICN